jgi:hypothetical protein
VVPLPFSSMAVLGADGRVFPPGYELEARSDIADAIDLAHAPHHGCVVTRDGRARCFGANGWAQLGDGTSTAREHVVDVDGITHANGIAVLPNLSCALQGRDISCWGTLASAPDEQHVALRNAVSVVVDPGQTCATTSSGENLCWGRMGHAPFESDPRGIFASSRPQPLPFKLGTLRELDSNCWQDELGVRVCGTMHEPDGKRVVAMATMSTGFTQVSRDTDLIWSGRCVLLANALNCVGDEALALPELRQPSALSYDGGNVCVIHAGGKVGCAELVRNWRTWAFTKLAEVPDLDSARQLLDTGSNSYAALDRHGDVWVWFIRSEGRISSVERLPPPMTGITKIFVDSEGMCGLASSGEVLCLDWRDDSITVRWTDVVDADGCQEHQCVVQRDGLLTCTGANRFGQLGALPQTAIAQRTAIEFEAE